MKPVEVRVEWIDSGAASGGGWKLAGEHVNILSVAMKNHPARTMGFIFGVDDDNLYVAQTWDSGFGNFLNAQAMYRPNIVGITVIGKKRRKKVKNIRKFLSRIQKKDKVKI